MKAEKTRKKLHDWANMLFTHKYAADSINYVLGELEIIEEQSDKWVEKETPYKVNLLYHDERDKKHFSCSCNAVVEEGENYCWNCGRRITFN